MITNILPIAIFCYKRVNHLKQTICSLQTNKLSKNCVLYCFSDGPKKFEDIMHVNKVRKYLKTISDFKNIIIIERESNLGLSTSIISGVSKVLEAHDRVIVLEDDLELSPYFLNYMTDALSLYQDNPEVASIHGYTLPVKTKLPDTFFLKGADCWGWATWRRAWNTFEQDGEYLLKKLIQKKLTREFDLDGYVGNTQMLKDQIAGKNDSWAIRWHASCFLNNMLTLHPGRSLVKNIGLEGTGQHCVKDLTLDTQLSFEAPVLKKIEPSESQEALIAYKQFYKSQRKSFLVRTIKSILKRLRVLKI